MKSAIPYAVRERLRKLSEGYWVWNLKETDRTACIAEGYVTVDPQWSDYVKRTSKPLPPKRRYKQRANTDDFYPLSIVAHHELLEKSPWMSAVAAKRKLGGGGSVAGVLHPGTPNNVKWLRKYWKSEVLGEKSVAAWGLVQALAPLHNYQALLGVLLMVKFDAEEKRAVMMTSDEAWKEFQRYFRI